MRIARILKHLGLIGITLMLVGSLVYATAGEPGITFAAPNGFNLTVDSQATYNGLALPSSTWAAKDLVVGVDKFFNLNNILPGDSGNTTISVHVNQDAWMCLAFSNLKNMENGENEPEDPVDPSNPAGKGELAEGTEMFAWRDDGDNVFEVGEVPLFGTSTQSAATVLASTTYALADFNSGLPMPAGSTRYVGISWCAGNLTVNLATAQITCDGSTLGNIAQSDSFSVDMGLQAASAAEQPKFSCALGGEPATTTPKTPGLGEQIGLFVKCQTIATFGWPLPTYKTECPGGFSTKVQAAPLQAPVRTDRTTGTNRSR